MNDTLAGLTFAVLILLSAPVYADLLVSSQMDPTANTILRYDETNGTFLGVFAAGGGLDDPLGITFGPDGHLYVASANSNEVLRYDERTGAFLGVFAAGGGLLAPMNVTFGPDGNLYVTSFFGNQVLRYSGTTGAFIDVFASGGGLVQPRGLRFGPDGNLYVVSYDAASVLRYDGTTGTFVDTFVPARSGGLFTPNDLAFGPDGNLYVTGGASPNPGVFRYNGITGAYMDQFASVGDNSPIDLAFGPDGNLYVVTQGLANGVLRFNGTTGAFIDAFVPSGSGGLSNPFGLAFSPRSQDSDGDGVADEPDRCPNTRPGDPVDSHGCSIPQLVPCVGPLSGGYWKNHGQYVSSVVKTAKAFLDAGLISQTQKRAIVIEAAKSRCGIHARPRVVVKESLHGKGKAPFGIPSKAIGHHGGQNKGAFP